jgi:hypothetical protein
MVGLVDYNFNTNAWVNDDRFLDKHSSVGVLQCPAVKCCQITKRATLVI